MKKHIKKRLLAALDLSMMDKYILSFLRMNSQVLTSEKIHFIHVEEALSPHKHEGSAEKSDHPDSSNPLKQLNAAIAASFPEADSNYGVRIVQGKPEKEIMKCSTEEGIDLLVVGQKATTQNEVEIKRLVKKAGTSLLIIPKKDDYSIRNVCVSIDFSDLSKDVAKEAYAIAESIGAKLIGFHSYQVPSGYHKTGKDHQEFAAEMEENAKNDAEKYWRELGLTLPEMHYMYDEENSPAECIVDFAEKNDIDLLLIGSKGRTAAASILLDSVAEEVAKLLHTVPLMILKEKNNNMDMLDALKKV